jgi:arsenical pump membrane protein
VPWSLLVFAGGLFLAVGALEALGIGQVTTVLAGTGDDLVSLWQLAGVGALAANGINNLPAYLALESVAGSPARLAALLVGVNAGPIVTPWASLATLLWHERLVAAGVEVKWSRFIVLGAVIAPLILLLGVLPLAR